MRSDERKIDFGPIEFKDFRLSHRISRSSSAASEQKCTCCPTEPGAFDRFCLSSREGRLRVARHFSAGYRLPLRRVPEGRLKCLARALLEACRCFAGTAVHYPRWHRVPPFKRPSGTQRLSIPNPALKCRATFNRPYRDEERPRVPDGMAVNFYWGTPLLGAISIACVLSVAEGNRGGNGNCLRNCVPK